MRILLLNTGGTISSLSSDSGKKPQLTAVDLLRRVEVLDCKYTVESKDVFQLDSTDIGPREWRQLARIIVESDRKSDYDAYIVLHGTDTMAYTGAGLSLLLRKFPKPIFMTGAQRTADEDDYDGLDNLRHSLLAALRMGREYSGIFVVFAGRLLHACHAVKIDTKALSAFASIGAPLVAKFDSFDLLEINHLWQEKLQQRRKINNRLYDKNDSDYLIDPLDPHVLTIQMTPGLDPKFFPQLAEGAWPLRGLILESYGSGGLPLEPRNYATYLRRLVDAGVFVVLGTQVMSKDEDLERYEVGQRSHGVDLVAQGGLTAEAALAKVMWILPQSRDHSMLAKLYQEDLVFEQPF